MATPIVSILPPFSLPAKCLEHPGVGAMPWNPGGFFAAALTFYHKANQQRAIKHDTRGELNIAAVAFGALKPPGG